MESRKIDSTANVRPHKVYHAAAAKPRRIVSTVDLSEDGLGNLSIELAADGTLALVRRDHEDRQVASLALLRSELNTLADTLGLAAIELRAQPASARAPGASRFGLDGRPAT